MFRPAHPICKERFVIIGKNGNCSLGDDRAAIQHGGDEVNRGPVDRGPGCEDAAVDVKPGKRGE